MPFGVYEAERPADDDTVFELIGMTHDYETAEQLDRDRFMARQKRGLERNKRLIVPDTKLDLLKKTATKEYLLKQINANNDLYPNQRP